jgi:hypothetical protein
MTRHIEPAKPPQCKKGTFNGDAAKASPYEFARCVLPADHSNPGPGCDSGPAPDDEPPKRAA